jgi:polysaccharide biosynthesis/export protein
MLGSSSSSQTGLGVADASALSPNPNKVDARSPSAPELRIGSDDVLDIKVYTVYGAPDIAQTSRVSSQGDIELPLIGHIHLAGLTADQAQTAIERQYKDGQFLKNPHVSVFVAQYATQGISVLGEVMKPGIFPPAGARMLSDVIADAGGLSPNAGSIVTITRRQTPRKPLTVALLGDGTPVQNLEILPGDTVVVSKTGVVYVVGEVGKPGGFPVNSRSKLTVLEAIALAEGTKPTAALNSSSLIRKSGQNLSEVQIPLKKILTGKSPDMVLQAGDIVFVPNSTAKSVARRSLDAIVQTASGYAVYH